MKHPFILNSGSVHGKPQRRCWWWFRFSRNHWSMRFIILLLHMILFHLGLDTKLAIRSVARHGARSCCHKRKHHHHHHIVMRRLCNRRFALAMKHGDNDVESITRNYFCGYYIVLMSVTNQFSRTLDRITFKNSLKYVLSNPADSAEIDRIWWNRQYLIFCLTGSTWMIGAGCTYLRCLHHKNTLLITMVARLSRLDL